MKIPDELIAVTKRALRSLDASHVYVGIVGNHPVDEARIQFLIELGHCVLTGKTIIIPVPYGMDVPPKLAAVADRIVRYDPNRMETLQHNLAVALTEMGINPQ